MGFRFAAATSAFSSPDDMDDARPGLAALTRWGRRGSSLTACGEKMDLMARDRCAEASVCDGTVDVALRALVSARPLVLSCPFARPFPVPTP